MQDSTSSILGSAKRFFSGTMLSRITGMFRDMAMAFAFGTQADIAAFLTAFRLSHLLRRILGEGALQTAFIPHFEELRHKSPDQACRFFRDLTAALTFLLSCIIIITMLGLGGLLWKGNLNQSNYEITLLALIMMPSLLFICLYGMNASILQCEKNYFTPSAAPVAFNAVWIVAIACLARMPSAKAMPWLAGAIIIACFGQWIITVPKTLSILRKYGMSNWRSSIKLYSPDVKRLGKPLLLGIIGVAAAQINNALDTIFARYADAEGPALLWYSIRVQQLPLALFGIAISGALLPPLSRAIKSNDLPMYRHFLEFALCRSTALMLPITLAFLVLGDSCINLIYGRGDFTGASTIGTTQCLWAYGLGLVPMTLVLILAPAFYAMSNYTIPSSASVIAMVLNISLNAVFVAQFGLGAASVAAATSLSALLNMAILGVALRNQIGNFISKTLGVSLCKTVIISVAAAAAVIIFDDTVYEGNNALLMLQGKPPALPHHFATQLIRFGMQSLVFSVTLLGTAFVFKAKDLLDLLLPFRKALIKT
jgi:putative peptidoglycan lipid II flippase